VSSAVVGLCPSVAIAGVGLFSFFFFASFGNASSQALWQTKVAAEVQGRVFTVRRMVARSCQPLGFLLAGPLCDRAFEPLLLAGGPLAGTPLGSLIGVGPGRGTGLLIVVGSLLFVAIASISLLHPRIRQIESEIPDAAP